MIDYQGVEAEAEVPLEEVATRFQDRRRKLCLRLLSEGSKS